MYTFAQAQHAHDHSLPHDDELPDCPYWVAEALSRNPAFVDEALSERMPQIVAGFIAGDAAQAIREAVSDFTAHVWRSENFDGIAIVQSWAAHNARRVAA